jgi:hypothetical protein
VAKDHAVIATAECVRGKCVLLLLLCQRPGPRDASELGRTDDRESEGGIGRAGPEESGQRDAEEHRRERQQRVGNPPYARIDRAGDVMSWDPTTRILPIGSIPLEVAPGVPIEALIPNESIIVRGYRATSSPGPGAFK